MVTGTSPYGILSMEFMTLAVFMMFIIQPLGCVLLFCCGFARLAATHLLAQSRPFSSPIPPLETTSAGRCCRVDRSV